MDKRILSALLPHDIPPGDLWFLPGSAPSVAAELPPAPSPPPTQADIDREIVGRAADPAEYEQLSHTVLPLPCGAEAEVFDACRIGKGHLEQGLPCQDACLSQQIRHGVVLANADGISACGQGRYGSRAACEAAAEEIAQLSQSAISEDAFIRELCSDGFFRRIRQAWMDRVTAHWLTLPDRNPRDNPLRHYGTTLIIAVVTDRWITTLNLGDGQILLFGDEECMRVQLVDKESQAPSCLVYDDCPEDLRRGVWPRSAFRGVMLITDGVHDQLSRLPGDPCLAYVRQTADRFCEHHAPHQPFILTSTVRGEERTWDVSRQRGAIDDASLVMALFNDYVPDSLCSELRSRLSPQTQLQLHRRVCRSASYLAANPQGLKLIISVPQEEAPPLRDPRLSHLHTGRIKLWQPAEVWHLAGRRCSVYELPADVTASFLEEDMQGFVFKASGQDRRSGTSSPTGRAPQEVEPLADEPILRFRSLLNDLENHLLAQGLALSELALYCTLHLPGSPDALWLPAEALRESDAPPPRQPWTYAVGHLNPSLIGYLVCDGRAMPLFGHRQPRSPEYGYYFSAPQGREADNRFFALVYNARADAYGLLNVSQTPWQMTRPDGTGDEIPPGAVAGLAEGRRLTVQPPGLEPFTCVMHML